MGASVSQNVSEFQTVSSSLSESINSAMTSIAQTSVSDINPTQLMKVRIVSKGDFNFSENEQIIVANIDVNKFIEHLNETRLKSLLTTAVQASAKENQTLERGLLIGGSYSKNMSKTQVMQQNVMRVVNSYSHQQLTSDASRIFGTQTIEITASVSGDANILRNKQYMKVSILSSQIASVMTKTFQDIVNESSVTAKKEIMQASSEGFSFSFGSFAIFFVVVLIIIAIVAGIWYFKGGGREMVEEQLRKVT